MFDQKDMFKVPSAVRRRLSQVAVGADHPDAGLFTALVEGTLPKRPRDDLFGHLAACSECNQLVALIARQAESSSATQAANVRRQLRWAPLSWAGATAALAIIVTVLIGRMGHETKAPAFPTVAFEKPPASVLTGGFTAQPDTLHPTHQPSQRRSNSRRLAQPGETPQQLVPQDAVPRRYSAATDDVLAGAFQTSMMSGAGAWFEPPPNAIERPIVKAEPAPPAATNAPAFPIRTDEPVWSLSEAGALRKSNDGGNTWAEILLPTRLPLRALSVAGRDIWTGGDQGKLYHSTDAGQTWAAVNPVSNGVQLSDDIIRIAFIDLHRGGIATRNGEIWTTGDGGLTWSH